MCDSEETFELNAKGFGVRAAVTQLILEDDAGLKLLTAEVIASIIAEISVLPAPLVQLHYSGPKGWLDKLERHPPDRLVHGGFSVTSIRLRLQFGQHVGSSCNWARTCRVAVTAATSR